MDVFKHAVECESIIYFIFILKLVVIVMMNSCNYTIFFVVCFSLVPLQKGVAVAAEFFFNIYLLFKKKKRQNTKTKLK